MNLSDLAACGAQPLALYPGAGAARGAKRPGWSALPTACTRWPTRTAASWWAATPPRAVDHQHHRHRPCPRAVPCCTSGAKPGDDLYVSGHLGDARSALEVFRGTVSVSQQALHTARQRMEQPTRVWRWARRCAA